MSTGFTSEAVGMIKQCADYGPVDTHVDCQFCGGVHEVQHSVSRHQMQDGTELVKTGLVQFFTCGDADTESICVVGIHNRRITDHSSGGFTANQFLDYLDSVKLVGLDIEPKTIKTIRWTSGWDGGRKPYMGRTIHNFVGWELKDAQLHVCSKLGLTSGWTMTIGVEFMQRDTTSVLELFMVPREPDCSVSEMMQATFPDAELQQITPMLMVFMYEVDGRDVRVTVQRDCAL